ncbi:MAG: hypothetical protein JSV80_16270, partial [Acidobacteriota bacterium]
LWDNYKEDCGSDLFCQLSCYVTPQNQTFDQGTVTVDDNCTRTDGSSTCTPCGYNETYTRSVLEQVLPPEWCGTAGP